MTVILFSRKIQKGGGFLHVLYKRRVLFHLHGRLPCGGEHVVSLWFRQLQPSSQHCPSKLDHQQVRRVLSGNTGLLSGIEAAFGDEVGEVIDLVQDERWTRSAQKVLVDHGGVPSVVDLVNAALDDGICGKMYVIIGSTRIIFLEIPF